MHPVSGLFVCRRLHSSGCTRDAFPRDGGGCGECTLACLLNGSERLVPRATIYKVQVHGSASMEEFRNSSIVLVLPRRLVLVYSDMYMYIILKNRASFEGEALRSLYTRYSYFCTVQ